MKNSETTTIGFASAGHTLCHLLTLLFPTVLLALEVEMELSFKELAALAVAAAFIFAAGALPAGWLGDRWSKTTLLEIFFYGTGTACRSGQSTHRNATGFDYDACSFFKHRCFTRRDYFTCPLCSKSQARTGFRHEIFAGFWFQCLRNLFVRMDF